MNSKINQSHQWDVIVAGGGPTGIIAAIAAARCGAKVLLIERYGFLGGLATFHLPILSFLDSNGAQMVSGIPEEFIQRVKSMGGSPGHFTHPVLQSYTPVDSEIVKNVALLMMQESKVNLLLHNMVVNVEASNDIINNLLVQSKSAGYHKYSSSIIIDATGDADIAFKSGVPVRVGREKDGLTQAATLLFRMGNVNLEEVRKYLIKYPEESYYPLEDIENTYIFMGFKKLVEKGKLHGDYNIPRDYLIFHRIIREDEVAINTGKILGLALDVGDLTEAEIEGRKQMSQLVNFLKKYVPGFAKAYLIDSTVQIGIRETRRIIGDYVLSTEDVLSGHKFSDGITRSRYPLDIHDPSLEGSFLQQLSSPYEIPYRCLIPRVIRNLLVAGRCISGTHEALSSARVMGTCMAMGQAAGVAAALCALEGIPPNKLEVSSLLGTLKSQGALVRL